MDHVNFRIIRYCFIKKTDADIDVSGGLAFFAGLAVDQRNVKRSGKGESARVYTVYGSALCDIFVIALFAFLQFPDRQFGSFGNAGIITIIGDRDEISLIIRGFHDKLFGDLGNGIGTVQTVNGGIINTLVVISRENFTRNA